MVFAIFDIKYTRPLAFARMHKAHTQCMRVESSVTQRYLSSDLSAWPILHRYIQCAYYCITSELLLQMYSCEWPCTIQSFYT